MIEKRVDRLLSLRLALIDSIVAVLPSPLHRLVFCRLGAERERQSALGWRCR